MTKRSEEIRIHTAPPELVKWLKAKGKKTFISHHVAAKNLLIELMNEERSRIDNKKLI